MTTNQLFDEYYEHWSEVSSARYPAYPRLPT